MSASNPDTRPSRIRSRRNIATHVQTVTLADPQSEAHPAEAVPEEVQTNAFATVQYDELPEFLTPDELAQVLRLSRNTVYDVLRRGEIVHVRFGRQIRIPKAALRRSGPI